MRQEADILSILSIPPLLSPRSPVNDNEKSQKLAQKSSRLRNVLDQPTALNLLGILNLLNSRPPPASANLGRVIHPNYANIMEKKAGSFLKEHKGGTTQASEALCQSLLDGEQAIPPDTIFRDDTFAEA
ncbi:MAG: hypothetical protein Q9205_004779 [Flavoplaca limonia]